MQKLRNPFAGREGYNCFGCSPDNPVGLRLSFIDDGDEIVSRWQPVEHFHGYQNILHGGIQATLMDEIASWVVYVKVKRSGVTSTMNVRYLNPVFVDRGAITLRARVVAMRRNLADIEVKLFQEKRINCVQNPSSHTLPTHRKNQRNHFFTLITVISFSQAFNKLMN